MLWCTCHMLIIPVYPGQQHCCSPSSMARTPAHGHLLHQTCWVFAASVQAIVCSALMCADKSEVNPACCERRYNSIGIWLLAVPSLMLRLNHLVAIASSPL